MNSSRVFNARMSEPSDKGRIRIAVELASVQTTVECQRGFRLDDHIRTFRSSLPQALAQRTWVEYGSQLGATGPLLISAGEHFV